MQKYSAEADISRDKNCKMFGVHFHTTAKYSYNKDLAWADWALQFQWGFQASFTETTKRDYGITFVGLEFVLLVRDAISDVFSS